MSDWLNANAGEFTPNFSIPAVSVPQYNPNAILFFYPQNNSYYDEAQQMAERWTADTSHTGKTYSLARLLASTSELTPTDSLRRIISCEGWRPQKF